MFVINYVFNLFSFQEYACGIKFLLLILIEDFIYLLRLIGSDDTKVFLFFEMPMSMSTVISFYDSTLILFAIVIHSFDYKKISYN